MPWLGTAVDRCQGVRYNEKRPDLQRRGYVVEIRAVTGIIFDIKRFAIHDGPGIRTTVFFKGCTLHCYWCHNPESISPWPQLAQFPRNCIGCGTCMEVCPSGAIGRGDDQVVVDRRICNNCGVCAAQCPSGALVMQGREVTAEEVIAEVVKDKPFYDNSGGGITLSGGEPLFQPAFAQQVLAAAKAEGLHTALDTCGYVAWEHLAAVVPYVDLVLYDLKVVNNPEQERAIGAEKELVTENLRRLAWTDVEIWVRTPVVGGFNADREHIAAIAEEVRRLRRRPAVLELLPYHPLGESKRRSLGMAAAEPTPLAPTRDQMKELADIVSSYGIECRIEGEGI